MKLTEIINKYLNNEKISNETYDEALLKLSIEQSLQTILYSVTGLKEYKKYYISWVVKQEEFFAIQKEISEFLNKNNINHLYFKGSVLSKIYDDSSVRTRGDIDLFVGPDDFDNAKALFIENGYQENQSGEDCMHHIAYRKNNIEVELHFNMLDSDVDPSWRKLFYQPFQYAIKVNQNEYQLNDTYHFLFCLMHFAHHLRFGAGIRYLLDFYYMFVKTQINMDLLHKLIKETKLTTLYSNIINELRVLTNKDFDNTIKKEDVSFFENYMLSYGIHGNSNNETSFNNARHKHKIRYTFTRAFLIDKNYRLAKHPKLGKHWYTYPLCLIIHLFYLLTHKLKAFFNILFGKNNNKNLYKKLGV